MSADNGIYIGEFPDGFRVIHAQAIDNIFYYPEFSDEWYEMMDAYWGGTKEVYRTTEEAILEAQKMAENCEILEYGIQLLGQFPSFKKEKEEKTMRSIEELKEEAKKIVEQQKEAKVTQYLVGILNNIEYNNSGVERAEKAFEEVTIEKALGNLPY